VVVVAACVDRVVGGRVHDLADVVSACDVERDSSYYHC